MLSNTFVVSTTADSGVGSLRAAITAANSQNTPSTIDFAIPGAGIHTIAITSTNLPIITKPVTIDGSTQSGYAGTPVIQLDDETEFPQAGIWITGGNSTVRGLDITSFHNAVIFDGGGGNVAAADWIGVDTSGSALGNEETGVEIAEGSKNNIVGGTTSDDRNVISGNNDGVDIVGSGSTGNLVEGNYIGTGPSGATAMPNNGFGVLVAGSASSNTIGGSTPGAGNLISGNGEDGVNIQEAGTNVVEGNLIGTDASGTGPLGNGGDGVDVAFQAPANTIGGPGAARNVISGNAFDGVELQQPSTNGNVVAGNFIGTDAAGTSAIANGAHGIEIWGEASSNTIGGTTVGARNVISGNTFSAVSIHDLGTTNNVVEGNYLGTTEDGSAALGNGQRGVDIWNSASTNTVGGLTTGSGNVISGNGWDAIGLSGGATSHNVVEGNLLGTNAAGTTAIPNAQDGVQIWGTASSNTIGGTSAAARNLISGNAGDGVFLHDSGTTGNVIEGNYVGSDLNGGSALGNGGSGVELYGGASANTLGGTTSGAGNVIGGNRYDGVIVGGAGTSRNLVEGNLIGATASGTAALGNGLTTEYNGVQIWGEATNNTVGGTTTTARNVISGNGGEGVALNDDGTENNLIEGNYIGTTASGSSGLPNAFDGVGIWNGNSEAAGPQHNVVGGTAAGAGNVIADNSSDGVWIDAEYGDTTDNSVLGNSIFSNAGLGIDLTDGGNGGLLAPVVTSAEVEGGTMSGSATATGDRIEVYTSPSCISNHEQGKTYVGSAISTASGWHLSAPLTSGEWLTATETNQAGGTSQFSSCFEAFVPAPAILDFTPPAGTTGSQVTISGNNLTDTSAVDFNGTPANYNVNSDSQITAVVPSSATSGTISVTTPGGTATSGDSFAVLPPAPTISGFTPFRTGVGATVTINGAHFTGTTAVTFNGTDATSYSVASDAKIMAVVPSGVTTGAISVTTAGGTAESANSFTLLPEPPTIRRFSPVDGRPGTSISITGIGMSRATAVTFNGVEAASFDVIDDGEINAVVPAGATSGPISVMTPSGTGRSSSSFEVLPAVPAAPQISSFNPISGMVGAQVTISGSGFEGATAVAFNGVGASFNVISDKEIRATVPGQASNGSISVTTPAGLASSSASFTVTVLSPSVDSFDPTNSPVGSVVTISGERLGRTNLVAFNGTPATDYRVDSATSITATVPDGATTGPISVRTAFGTGISAADFTVTDSTNTVLLADHIQTSRGVVGTAGGEVRLCPLGSPTLPDPLVRDPNSPAPTSAAARRRRRGNPLAEGLIMEHLSSRARATGSKRRSAARR